MFEKNLKEKFDGMLPYMKKEFPSIINNILQRAKKIDTAGFSEDNIEEIQRIVNDARKILDMDAQLKGLFDQMK